MKVLDKDSVRAKKQEKRVRTEIMLLMSLNSPFICSCYGAHDDTHAYYLLMEMLVGGELKRVIHPNDNDARERQFQSGIDGNIVGIPVQAAKFYAAALAIPLMHLNRYKGRAFPFHGFCFV
jgi:serine/threonine protein kinase